MGSVPRGTMHADGLECDGQAALTDQQTAATGGAFPQTGDKESCVLQSHLQQGLQLCLWGSGRDGVLLHAMHRDRGPLAMYL